ncbi:MAG: DHA2 family efflux MFS transporter permease subunit, partial [Lentisphaerota bacterium]
KLGDRIGLKKVFISGYAFFVLGSLLCGFSPSIRWLVASRLIQGLGGAMLISTAFAIIANHVPEKMSGAALGIVSTASALGVSVGAPLGGFITGFISWHWIFLVNVPVGLVAIYITIRVLPSTPKAEKNRAARKQPGFDVQGALLTFVSLTLLVYALSMGREMGWASPIILASLAGFAVLLALLVQWEKKHSDPLLDVRLLKNPDFAFAALSGFFCFLFMAGNSFLQPFFLELVKGLHPASAGLLLMIMAVTVTLIAPHAGRLSDKIPPSIICSVAMALAAAACLVFALTLQEPGYWSTIFYLVLAGIALGLFISPNTHLVMMMAPAGKQGLASGTFQTLTSVSLAVGVCLFETVFSDQFPKGMNLSSHLIDREILMTGFHNAYIFGVLICLMAFLFSAAHWRRALKSKEDPKKIAPLHFPMPG